jgi:hypothetical protein
MTKLEGGGGGFRSCGVFNSGIGGDRLKWIGVEG